nr:MAG TPA: hypothetical protein [Caudoviricetes sp.]
MGLFLGGFGAFSLRPCGVFLVAWGWCLDGC